MNYLFGIVLIVLGLGFYFLIKKKESYENKSNDSSLYSKSQNIGGYIFMIVLIIFGVFSLFKGCS
ncbi:hypothetical protein [Chryseobacterium rhizosphaerae]|uniref:hypothetical protein n=1 Tax=Chryseobacterium rhizosphaerae TaxID=395937 RepID=UPI0023589B35|nr:hypothetical protein [Chryseobacterium rhizosphaerae]MDC8101888.1 hypothetical protein [Chryseobacterium rhizosphaerae]